MAALTSHRLLCGTGDDVHNEEKYIQYVSRVGEFSIQNIWVGSILTYNYPVEE